MGKSLVDETLATIKDVQGRIKAALTKAAETVKSAKKSKEEVANKFAAERRVKKVGQLFEKYDKNCDGLLNLKDVQELAKGEFDFDIPDAALNRIREQLFKEADGIGPSMFFQVRAAVG